jgi:hypothetical protein
VMPASAFASALEAIGVRATVEERGKLAVLVPSGDETWDRARRRMIVTLARAHGFANVCIEDAALSGD